MNMLNGCSYFGSMKKEDMTPEIEEHLERLFLYLIFIKKVTLFYTSGKTDFDIICTSILLNIRAMHSFISIVKVSKDNDRFNADKYFAYDYVLPYGDENYEKHCKYISKKCRYIILDSIENIKLKTNLFADIFFENSNENKTLPRIYLLDNDDEIFVFK